MSKGNNVKLLGIFLLLATILLGCGSASPVSKNIENYTGPEITKVVVDKSQRKIFLLNNKKIIRKFKIGLGFAPQNHKIKQGDGRTPEGLYFIDRKNYNSKYFLSMGISYPNANDTRIQAEIFSSMVGHDIKVNTEKKIGQLDVFQYLIKISEQFIQWLRLVLQF